MYAIINHSYQYGKNSPKKSWLMEDSYTGRVALFDTRKAAEKRLAELEAGDTMYLSHNEYSNRYYVRRLTNAQLARLA